MTVERNIDLQDTAAKDSAEKTFQETSLVLEIERNSPVDVPSASADEELQALRKLLLQREISIIEGIQQRLTSADQQAQDVSDVIAEALIIRASKDDTLLRSLEPITDKIIKKLFRKKPLEFANLIFPLIGPAVRRAIAETFRSMMESFSKSIEIAFSLKGLRWRFEALRTGKSFSDVVMLHSLVYRVEQVFFIHSETGLVLAHAQHEGAETRDADMVSAMLTAVQDFVLDCFATGSNRAGQLESMQLEDSTILVEKHPFASLACVVRGVVPSDFRERLRSTLELLLVRYAEELSEFSGDTSGFLESLNYLDDCLISRAAEAKETSRLAKMVSYAVVALVCFSPFAWWFNAYLDNKTQAVDFAIREKTIAALQVEPGVSITAVLKDNPQQWEVYCLVDALARPVKEVMAEAGGELDKLLVHASPTISYDTAIVQERVRRTIKPPQTAQVVFHGNGTLLLTGEAPMEWILRAREEALGLPGVREINTKEISDPRMVEIGKMIEIIESTSVYFPLGSDAPRAQDAPKLREAVDTLVELEELAKIMGMSVNLTVYGHADAVGSERKNYTISQERAKTLAAMLYARGSSIPVSLYGMGADYAQSGSQDERSRRIELHVRLQRLVDPTASDLQE